MTYPSNEGQQLVIALAAGARLGRLRAEKLAIQHRALQAEIGRQAAAERLQSDVALTLPDLLKAPQEARSTTIDPLSLGRLYALTLTWRPYSQEAAAAETSIRATLNELHGIDPEQALVVASPQLVQDQFERYQLERLRGLRAEPRAQERRLGEGDASAAAELGHAFERQGQSTRIKPLEDEETALAGRPASRSLEREKGHLR